MIISFDFKAYCLSKLNNYREKNADINNKKNFFLKWLGQGSGPQEFVSDLISNIKKRNLANVTSNFLISDLHMINSGNYNFLWKYADLKYKKNVVLRLDGIGIDSYTKNPIDLNKNHIFKLIKKTNYAIFQSKFCRECFKNIYDYEPYSSVIYNGANYLYPLNFESRDIIDKLKRACKDGFFVVAGRNVPRKRILETVEAYNKISKSIKPNLVVLSDLPQKSLFFNKKIINIGLINPFIARHIISNSLGLIHLDRYDWCPNIVVAANFDNVPVICSNYGGTQEIVRSNGIIIKEFPNDLPPNMKGIEFSKTCKFPDKLFKDALDKLYLCNPVINNENKLSLDNSALEYINLFKRFLKN